MKALQINGIANYSIIDMDEPIPQDTEVLVKIEIASTCPRWDINMMRGRDMIDTSRVPQYPLLPGQPGHEAAGVVCSIGKSVENLRIGDRVASLVHDQNRQGAYAQYQCFEAADLIKLPDSVSYKQATSFELLKCVMFGLEQLDELKGSTIAICGLGPAGILAMQIAKIWGATRVIGTDINDQRLAYVRSLNIGEVMHPSELTDHTIQLGYECVGSAAALQSLIEHPTIRHVVIFGVLRGETIFGEHLRRKAFKLEFYRPRIPVSQIKTWILEAMEKGLDTTCIQTHHIPFTRYRDAVELLESQEAIKVNFYPQQDFD
ncbi:zinc-binding dehydrogenase [Paenibacillus sp. MY03]|uniref:zinc-dependent alcohol dehydrogenase n=1 Tax=Paenibacillus sp. MY03 TaxID=302980 RepID=UPI0015C658E7|nr:zinc-binding dehydrogenase [Paenibacillus sp. MY03]